MLPKNHVLSMKKTDLYHIWLSKIPYELGLTIPALPAILSTSSPDSERSHNPTLAKHPENPAPPPKLVDESGFIQDASGIPQQIALQINFRKQIVHDVFLQDVSVELCIRKVNVWSPVLHIILMTEQESARAVYLIVPPVLLQTRALHVKKK